MKMKPEENLATHLPQLQDAECTCLSCWGFSWVCCFTCRL